MSFRGAAFGMLPFVIFALAILAFMFTGQAMYEDDLKNDTVKNDTQLINFTEHSMKWNYTDVQRNISEIENYDLNTIQSKRITNIIHSFVNFFGYSIMELAKWGFEYGYSHPEHDFEWYMNEAKLLAWIIIILLLIVSFFPLIVPLIALIVIIVLAIKKFITNKRRQKNEKKRSV